MTSLQIESLNVLSCKVAKHKNNGPTATLFAGPAQGNEIWVCDIGKDSVSPILGLVGNDFHGIRPIRIRPGRRPNILRPGQERRGIHVHRRGRIHHDGQVGLILIQHVLVNGGPGRFALEVRRQLGHVGSFWALCVRTVAAVNYNRRG